MTERTRQQMLAAERTRHWLAAHTIARQHAVAMFPLRVASMANDLQRAIEKGRYYLGDQDAANSLRAVIEGKIRDCFYETFGHEMMEECDERNDEFSINQWLPGGLHQ